MQVSICLHMCTQSCKCLYTSPFTERLVMRWLPYKALILVNSLKEKTKVSSLFPCKRLWFFDDVMPTAQAYLAAGDTRLTLKVA